MLLVRGNAVDEGAPATDSLLGVGREELFERVLDGGGVLDLLVAVGLDVRERFEVASSLTSAPAGEA
jgi:hypothetical protein